MQRFASSFFMLISFLWMLLIGSVATYITTQHAWAIQTLVGGRFDSPWLDDGFYTKERANDGQVYRWMGEQASIQLPAVRESYVVSLHASKGPTEDTKSLTLLDRGKPLIDLPLEKGFRVYSVFWKPDQQIDWVSFDNRERLTLSAPTTIFPGDDRGFGATLNGIQVSGNASGNLRLFGWIVAALLALWLFIKPTTWPRLAIYLGTSLVCMLVFMFLSWWPHQDSPWLPIVDAPSWFTLALWGIIFARFTPQRLWLFMLGVVGVISIILITYSQQWIVEGPDFTWHLNHGSSLATVFRVHAFYPLGFPLILWLGSTIFGNPLATGQSAALLCLLATLGLTMLLAKQLISKKAALISALALCSSPFFLGFGIVASTDMVQLVPLTAAFVVLLWHKQLSRRMLWWSGILFGVAYLFRFQAFMTLVLVIPWLFFQELPVSARWMRIRFLKRIPWAYALVLFIGGFLIGSAPQWIIDIRDTGRPFYSKQYENIWTFGYDRNDSPIDANQGLEGETPPRSTGIYDIVAFDPYQLARHWSSNLSYFGQVILHQVVIWPIGLLMLFSIGIVLIKRPDPRLTLCALISVLYVPIITLTANKERFYLPILPLVAMCFTWLIMYLNEQTITFGRWEIRVGYVVQALLFVWVIRHVAALEEVLAVYGFRALS